MKHDERLVKKVADLVWNASASDSLDGDGCLEVARAALDAINASGTHWLAPWEATMPMSTAGAALLDGAKAQVFSDDGQLVRMTLPDSSKRWASMRDAHLAEQAAKEAGDEAR